MPSQEEYLDNLLKGIDNEADQQDAKTSSEGSDAAEKNISEDSRTTASGFDAGEENVPQIDMSDMDDLLQSALEAQQKDAGQEQPPKGEAIHPEETASMSEDEIEKLLQSSREQAESAPSQETQDSNEDLIKMLEDADDADLSSILDQVTPEAAKEEQTEEAKEDPKESPEENPEESGNKRKKKKKEKVKKEKKEKKPGFFARFHKKEKEGTEPVTEETEAEAIPGEYEADGQETQEMPDTENGAAPKEKDDTVSWEPLTAGEDQSAEPGKDVSEDSRDAGNGDVADVTNDSTDSADGSNIADDDLDALLAGAFPEKKEEDPGASEPADVMDILKAAGADIVEEPEQKKEKKGFFAKLLDLFTEEDEDEEEAEQIQLSDENKKILDEMDKDKKKKGKKEKKQKKEKKPKEKKPAKEKKKKEKEPKSESNSASEKKLSPKKVIPVVVVCLTIGVVILLLCNFLTEYMSKRSGRKAYYEGDYQTCYQDLFGKDLNETEQIMYSKSESILTIRMWLREYDVFVNEGSELEALDSLLQAVHDYPSLLNYATEWNAQDEVAVAFQDILNILSQKYQLSQEEAQSIADISDNVEYTQNVMRILQNLGLGSWDFPEGTTLDTIPEQNTEETEEQLPDPLPEETDAQLQNTLPEGTEEQLQNPLPEEM